MKRIASWTWNGTQRLKEIIRSRFACWTIDRPGVLANVSSAISASQANISRAEITTREDQKAVQDFVIEITNTLQLERTLEAIGRVQGVISAKRVRNWQDS